MPPFILPALTSMTPVIIAAIVTAAAANGSLSLTRGGLIGAGVGIVFFIAGILFVSIVGAVFFLTQTLLTVVLGLPEYVAVYAISFIQILQTAVPAAVAGLIIAALAKRPAINLRRGALIGGSYGVISSVVFVVVTMSSFAIVSGPLGETAILSAVGYGLPLMVIVVTFAINIALAILIIAFIRSRRPSRPEM